MSENNSEITVEKDLNQINEISEKANNGVDVQFSFTIKELKHPGNWKNHHAMKTLFQCCSGFEVKFSKTPEDQARKSGQVTVFFDDLQSAQEALVEIKKCRFDGGPANIEAPECLKTDATVSAPVIVPEAKPSKFFTIPSDEAVKERTLYALHLFSSTNREIIDGIVDTQLVESVKFLPLGKYRQQAEIVITSADAVAGVSGDMDEFPLEDGEENSVMRVYNCEQYSKFVTGEEKLDFFKKEDDVEEEISTENQENAAPEIEEEEVTQAILEYVEVKRLNWAELNTREELYAICDIISAKFGGLPDSILKPAMLETLNKNLADNQQQHSSHWMVEHLHHLIREWKREIVSEAHFNRSSEVVMAAPAYAPVKAEEAKKRKYKNSKSGRAKLGVGAFLQDAKQSLATENGRHDIDEDDTGNILIDGEQLSFETWAKFTQSSQPDVVSAAQPKKARPAAPRMAMDDLKILRKKQRFAMEQRTGAKKMKIMEEARKELAALDEEYNENEKELDDGEIVSDDEKKKKSKKRKERNSSDSSSSSSSSSESEDDAPDSRKRRRNRRKAELKKKQNKPLAQNQVLVKLFENRRAIFQMLPIEQRTGFANILGQIHSSGSTATSNKMMQQASAMFKLQ